MNYSDKNLWEWKGCSRGSWFGIDYASAELRTAAWMMRRYGKFYTVGVSDRIAGLKADMIIIDDPIADQLRSTTMADADAFRDYDKYALHSRFTSAHGQPWDKEQEQTVVDKLKAKWPIEAIAALMGRSVYAIECRIEQIADRPFRAARIKKAIAFLVKPVRKVKRKKGK